MSLKRVYARPYPAKTGVTALKDALWRNPGFVPCGDDAPHFASLHAGYHANGPCKSRLDQADHRDGDGRMPLFGHDMALLPAGNEPSGAKMEAQ